MFTQEHRHALFFVFCLFKYNSFMSISSSIQFVLNVIIFTLTCSCTKIPWFNIFWLSVRTKLDYGIMGAHRRWDTSKWFMVPFSKHFPIPSLNQKSAKVWRLGVSYKESFFYLCNY